MTRHTRAVVLVAAVALAFLAAVNVGAAKPGASASGTPSVTALPGAAPSVRQAQCQPPTPTFPCRITAPNGNSAVVNSPQEIQTFLAANGGMSGQQPPPQGQQPPQGGGQGQGLPPCQPGQMPTPQAPCNTGGMPQGGQQGGMPQGGQQGGQQGGGQMGGGGINWANLAPCAAGQMPTPQAPCRMEIPPCAEGQMPSPQAPCRPQGMPGKEGEDMGGFDAPPTGEVQKDMKNKFMVININVQGSGDENGSFDVTFRKVVEGVGKQTRDYLNSQLEGESFVIQTSAKTVCFADTKEDSDRVPDEVSCKELDDAANKSPGSIRAQFRGKVSFDPKTYTPKFTAQKIVFLKGAFDVAEID